MCCDRDCTNVALCRVVVVYNLGDPLFLYVWIQNAFVLIRNFVQNVFLYSCFQFHTFKYINFMLILSILYFSKLKIVVWIEFYLT